MNMLDAINPARTRYTQHKPCPWCKEIPGYAHKIGNRFIVGCENHRGDIQFAGDTIEEAWAQWDDRA